MKKLAMMLALLLALMAPAALADGDYADVAMYEGERIAVSGYLQQEVRGEYWSGRKYVFILYLDQPLNFTMLRYGGGTSAKLECVQIVGSQDLTALVEKRVNVEGSVAFADDGNGYFTAVTITDAFASQIVDEETFYVPAPDLYEGYDSVKISGNVHLRDNPNLNGTSLGVMKKGETASYFGLSQKDERGVEWHYVYHDRLGGGWVSGKYAKLSKGAVAAPVGYVYAENGKYNMRKTPGLDGKILCTFKKGDYALYLNEDFWDDRGVQWYKVSYNDKVGWVSGRYTALVYPNAPWHENWDVKASGDVYVRTGPGLNYGICGVLKKGKSLPHLGDTYYDDRGVAWYSVSKDGSRGWVSGLYSKLVEN